MKKIIAIVVCLMMVVGLVGCGNHDMFDTVHTFRYAIIKLPDGEIVQGEVESWSDYEGEQLQIKFKGGNTYLTCSINAVLMVDMPKEVNNENN